MANIVAQVTAVPANWFVGVAPDTDTWHFTGTLGGTGGDIVDTASTPLAGPPTVNGGLVRGTDQLLVLTADTPTSLSDTGMPNAGAQQTFVITLTASAQ